MPSSQEETAIREEMRRNLADYFRAGAKAPDDCVRLGVEVEHFVVTNDGRPLGYEPADGLHGVREVLEALQDAYPKTSLSETGALIGLAGPDGSVSLEPSSQLELSAAPYAKVGGVEGAFRRFYESVDVILGPWGCKLVACGYHPTRRALDLPLIPKRRYDFMNAYFAHIGSHGERMMRASASTQVSVDFSSEQDAVRKMRLAAALAPVLAAMMDNTRVFEGRPNQVPIRRLQLWREVDSLRCETPRGLFDDGYGFEAYADWLLSTPPIFVDRPAASNPHGPALRPAFDVPAYEAYADAPLSPADEEHIASMFWPDVRLKRFVEVRPADSAPLPQVLGYTALVSGIFYSEKSRRAVEEALGVSGESWPIGKVDVEEARRSIQAHGFAGRAYGIPLATWESLLFSLAREALPADEAPYLDALEAFAADKSWWRPLGRVL